MVRWRSVWRTAVADHYGAVTAGMRAGSAVADLMHGALGTRTMQGALDGARHACRAAAAQVVAAHSLAPPGSRRRHRGRRPATTGSSISQAAPRAAMGAQRGDDAEALPVVAERLFRKAGFDVIYPRHIAGLCCGQPFESKGLMQAADRKAAELETALRELQRSGPLADRLRHKSVCVPDAALLRRPVIGSGQYRLHPRHRLTALDANAG